MATSQVSSPKLVSPGRDSRRFSDDHPRYVRDWIFGSDLGSYWPERAGFDPWLSLAVIVVVAVAGSAWVYRRYRRLA